jgi:hypothetical protein
VKWRWVLPPRSIALARKIPVDVEHARNGVHDSDGAMVCRRAWRRRRDRSLANAPEFFPLTATGGGCSYEPRIGIRKELKLQKNLEMNS